MKGQRSRPAQEEHERVLAAWSRFVDVVCSIEEIASDLEASPHLPGSKTTGTIRRLRNRARGMLLEVPREVVEELDLVAEIAAIHERSERVAAARR